MDTAIDPIALFGTWYAEAAASEARVPEAATLATADADGRPSARQILLKGWDDRGFVFYTNLGSRKAREIGANPYAALNLHWKSLGRQVRVRGAVEAVSSGEADAYFASRDRGSQIGAWASRQSETLDDQRTLEARVAEAAARFAGGDVPRPPFWSGFRVVPDAIEFWEDRASRLHRRREFHRQGGAWSVRELYP
jgi:pyridoxamine 5'-phosphate oxidase